MMRNCAITLLALVFVALFTSCFAVGHSLSPSIPSNLHGSSSTNGSVILHSPKLIITADGPTVLGDATTIRLSLEDYGNSSSFQFSCWSNETNKNESGITSNDTVVLWIRGWKEVGLKQIFGAVAFDDLRVGNLTVIRNTTFVTVAKTFNVCITVLQNHSNISCSISNCSIHQGNAHIQAFVCDQSQEFYGSNLSCSWELKESNVTYVTSENHFSYNFTRLGKASLHLRVTATHKGSTYVGSSDSHLSVKVIWVPGTLLIWQDGSHGPRVPTHGDTLATGLVNLHANVTHEYPSFSKAVIICYWTFGDGHTATTTAVNTQHNYTTTGTKYASVIVAIFVDHKSYEAHLRKIIIFEDGITELDVRFPQTITSKKKIHIDINCTGSSPVSFCWFISRNNCRLPHKFICSPTLVSPKCHAVINHIFYYPGSYCLNVTAVNGVSSAESHHDLLVHRAGHHGTHAIAALTVILLMLSLVIVVVVVSLMFKKSKRAKRHKQKKTEVATFDFRDSVSFEQGRLSSSLPTTDCRQSCFLWCFSCRRFSEDYPSQEHSTLFTTSPVEPTTPHRKISYYGAVHMGLLQQHDRSVVPDVPPPLLEEDELSESKDDIRLRPRSF